MNYKIADYNVEDFTGSMSIEVKVDGFWSTPLSIWVKQDYRSSDVTVKINHGSGGYDPDGDYVQASRNFAEAMLAACDLADQIKANPQPWTEARQANFERERDEDKIYEEKLQAKIDADTKMTANQIQDFLAGLQEDAEPRAACRAEFRVRGSEYSQFVTARKIRGRDGWRTQWNLNGHVIAKKSLEKHMRSLAAEIVEKF